MGVYKRGKHYWIRYNVSGRQYREPANTTSKALAEKLLAKRKLEIFEGKFFPDKKRGDLTLDGLRKFWLQHAADKKSLKDDRQRFKTIVDYLGATTRIAALSGGDVARLKKHLARASKPDAARA